MYSVFHSNQSLFDLIDLKKIQTEMSSQSDVAKRKIYEYAKDGDVNVLDNLIRLAAKGKLNVDADEDEDGRTPLMWAAYNGHLECLTALLSARAKVDIRDKNGWTPLIGAARFGHLNNVTSLLSVGAQVDIQRRMAGRP